MTFSLILFSPASILYCISLLIIMQIWPEAVSYAVTLTVTICIVPSLIALGVSMGQKTGSMMTSK
jgi:hypothetical protein